MKVLIACEFSGVVRAAFRKRGHDAWSCDLVPSLDNSPYHLIEDALQVMQRPGWDLMIAHPPCTYLSNMSNCRIKEPGRLELRQGALTFFLHFVNSAIPRFAVENPRGYPERVYRQPDQIIHPYHFGHPYSKATCLWLKDLPALKSTNVVDYERKWDGKRFRTWNDSNSNWDGKAAQRRSITFQGIADAMADQWGSL